MAAPYTNPPPQHPRGTAAALAASNLVIPDGVIVVETDTGRFKVGDGVTAWNSLRYSTIVVDDDQIILAAQIYG
jgi:hypothetical protein